MNNWKPTEEMCRTVLEILWDDADSLSLERRIEAALIAVQPLIAAPGACRGCERPYSKGPDLVVSDENWKRISPNGDLSGILCPNCMNDAFEAIGAPYGSIEAAFTSGPFANKNWKKP